MPLRCQCWCIVNWNFIGSKPLWNLSLNTNLSIKRCPWKCRLRNGDLLLGLQYVKWTDQHMDVRCRIHASSYGSSLIWPLPELSSDVLSVGPLAKISETVIKIQAVWLKKIGFENAVCKMALILSRHQIWRVNLLRNLLVRNPLLFILML